MPVQMVQLRKYEGAVGSGTDAQPGRLGVASAASVMMDFHAHLSDHEVIGLLFGRYTPESELLQCVPIPALLNLGTVENCQIWFLAWPVIAASLLDVACLVTVGSVIVLR